MYVDICTRVGFSSVTIEGKENLPTDCPYIMAPNHCGALMDAMLVLLTQEEEIVFGARADIFKNDKAASILRWLRILPMARGRDGRSEVAKNFDTIEEIVDTLEHNVPFGMFSEGTHRAQRGMLPVKKGIFKICRQAYEKTGKAIKVVPVGLAYESFFNHGNSVVIRIGEPMDVNAWFDANPDKSEAAIYKELCTELRERDLELIGRIPQRRTDRLAARTLGCLLSLPLFAVCAVLSSPIWLFAELILMKIKDKAWSHTVYFSVRLFLPILWPFFSGFGILLNIYRHLVGDIKNRFRNSSKESENNGIEEVQE